MSIATLKKKSKIIKSLSSNSQQGFSLNGGIRNLRPTGASSKQTVYYCSNSNDNSIVKKSSLSNSAMLSKRFPWIKTGTYPLNVVQVHASTLANGKVLTGDGSQGVYIKQISGINAQCVVNVEDAGYKPCAGGKAVTYIGTKKIYRLPYNKTTNNPSLDASTYINTKLLTKNCLPPTATLAPSPVFINNNSRGC
tara:strand:+ start:1042 stop:1623 length:582 start_codon:yes stop_codon:yes gene_type:complete